jgi:hypothetical protein
MTEAEPDTAIVQVCADVGVITTRANPRLSAETGPASRTGCSPRPGRSGRSGAMRNGRLSLFSRSVRVVASHGE